ncbi:hypothetical protein ACEQ8H_007862 [Pleosporales sp. CAS-2024a]
MGEAEKSYLGGILKLAKWKDEARAEGNRPKPEPSYSEPPTGTVHGHVQGKLHKPPRVQVQTRPQRPRNRLRKSAASLMTITQPPVALFVLEFEPYTNLVEPGRVLGIYSTFDAVTLGALHHGAYAFSREGLVDGSEYLTSTGRIKLVQTTVQYGGVRATLPERSRSLDGEPLRLDIPHPDSQEEGPREPCNEQSVVYLAVRQASKTASWIGVYQDKSLAWGACLKDKALCAMSDTLCDEKRSIGLNNMPQVSGRLMRAGRFTWKVEQHVIDASAPAPAPAPSPSPAAPSI